MPLYSPKMKGFSPINTYKASGDRAEKVRLLLTETNKVPMAKVITRQSDKARAMVWKTKEHFDGAFILSGPLVAYNPVFNPENGFLSLIKNLVFRDKLLNISALVRSPDKSNAAGIFYFIIEERPVDSPEVLNPEPRSSALAFAVTPAGSEPVPEVLNPGPGSSALAFDVTPAKAGVQRF